MNVTEFFISWTFVSIVAFNKTVNNQTVNNQACFIDDFTIFTTFCLYRIFHEIYYSKQTCFIYLEQTGRLRVP